MLYIFDLDYTLFDTGRFFADMSDRLNIDPGDWEDSYVRYFRDPGIDYNAYKHLIHLKQDGLIKSGKRAKEELFALLDRLDDYLYPGAETVLKRLRDRGEELVLLTFGDLLWQKIKVSKLSIRHYFDRILITDRDKTDSLVEFRDRPEVSLVNDRASEINKMQNFFQGKVKVYLIRGPYSNDAEHDFRAYGHGEAFKII